MTLKNIHSDGVLQASDARRQPLMRVFSRIAAVAAVVMGIAPAIAAETGQTPVKIVETFKELFGDQPGYRVVHAKGLICEGEFQPAPVAATVTRASHLQSRPVPVIVRFSDFAGIPTVASGGDLASPRGMAIKFALPDGGDTDIIAHSYDSFPAASPDDFLAFLKAVGASGPGAASPTPLEQFAGTHPAARRFLDTPKPIPVSYARERFFGVNAFLFTNAAGREVYGRYRIVPADGPAYLGMEDAARQAPDFLAAEMTERLRQGPAVFRLMLQLAETGDVVTDGTALWPEDRPQVELGRIVIRRIAADNREKDRELLFTPLNLVDGIGSSGDPLLVARSRAYAKSYSYRSGQ